MQGRWQEVVRQVRQPTPGLLRRKGEHCAAVRPRIVIKPCVCLPCYLLQPVCWHYSRSLIAVRFAVESLLRPLVDRCSWPRHHIPTGYAKAPFPTCAFRLPPAPQSSCTEEPHECPAPPPPSPPPPACE